jgi:hypothetical protein
MAGDLPHIAGPGGLRHPQHAAAVGLPQMRVEVPALGGDKGGPMETHGAAVLAGAGGDRFFLGDAGIRWRRDASQSVGLSGLHQIGDAKASTNECSLDVAEASAIEPYDRMVVNKRETAPGERPRRSKFCGIPVVLLVEGFGDGEVVQAIIGIRVHAAVHESRKHSTGNGRGHPVPGVEAGTGDLLPTDRDLGLSEQPPTAGKCPCVVAVGLERDARGRQRLLRG